MASTDAQRKWRQKHRFTKMQLNVMVRRLVHQDLSDVSERFGLRGKGEAVSFSAFVLRGLIQRADHDADAARLLDQLANAYARDRDLYQ